MKGGAVVIYCKCAGPEIDAAHFEVAACIEGDHQNVPEGEQGNKTQKCENYIVENFENFLTFAFVKHSLKVPSFLGLVCGFIFNYFV